MLVSLGNGSGDVEGKNLDEIGLGLRMNKQLRFLREIDEMKNVWRKTYLLNGTRFENDAEHSWEMAVMAAVLVDYAPAGVSLSRVIMMLLIHDLVEINAGDTYAYDEAAQKDQECREQKAADYIYGLLPSDQGVELRALWEEFEARETPDSKFARAMDRLQPLLHNYYTQGKAWKENCVKSNQVRKLMEVIKDASVELGDLADGLISDAIRKGFLAQ
ncbi:HD domain-containing protein [Pseudomonas aeruginosa]|uniref:HD domain-containing protein n=1 Tax=Pseudomonas aeruginosa TaxID=287 RepID=UPI0009AACAD5|nr:HD domain-containing protein [Pseudomonas aeruginosa]MBA4993822.1 HD domain-containing protein [Pseudomonas aeruginosa]MBG4276719.1 HD domain-containing protein [Pseudomonas aeruginosa]MBG4981213.1 HD domain-containing protein [Pseudomonas aeruginosa]MBG6832817.1 HD domain-containing protein [Pseudomonas aeruginosa]MCO1668429.1 HD domain-containing protein [Pseudomonas aeruginosa]